MTTIELHGFTLALPDDDRLLQSCHRSSAYFENIGRLAAIVEAKYPSRGFIEIGAKLGGIASIVRGCSKLPILCIEGSPIYRELLSKNVCQLQGHVELEYAWVDGASAERLPDLSDDIMKRVTRLDSILARHPRFQIAKILKIDKDGIARGVFPAALDWIRNARPILFWEYGTDQGSPQQPGFEGFDWLKELGYRTALVFDGTGEFLEKICFDNRPLLADLSEYLADADGVHSSCSICAFHDEDLDLCSRLRALELENRRFRKKPNSKILKEGSLHGLVRPNIEGGELSSSPGFERANGERPDASESLQGRNGAVSLSQPSHQELSKLVANRTAELQALRARAELNRYRDQLRLADLEKQLSSKDDELAKLRLVMRELIAQQAAENRHDTIAGLTAEIVRLNAKLEDVWEESEKLHRLIQTSLALRSARAFHWVLGPIRRLIVGPAPGNRNRP